VTIVGNLKGEFGIAETARSTAKALNEVKVPFGAFDFVCDKRHERGDKWFEENKIRDSAYFKYKVFILEESPGCIHHFAKVIPENEYKSQFKIIHTAWELDQLPDKLINDIKGLDEIWVASRYNVPVFAEHFSGNITVIPDVIEADYFTKPDRELVGLPQDVFVFLTTFDFNSFILRKNPQAIINAFKKMFKPDDKSVMLLITTINSKHNKEDYKTISKMIEGYGNIKMTTDTKPKSYVTILKKSVDVFVTAYRSEGFGLNVFESMALGKPVIATNYSAPADFMTEENAYPIPYKLVHFEGEYSGLSKSSLEKARWADIDVDILASTMLHVKNNPTEAKLKGLKAREDIENKLSAKAIGEKIRNRLDIIYNDILPKRSKKVIEIP
jgi:glycosyltransferase involved in cell wall biosynthesis